MGNIYNYSCGSCSGGCASNNCGNCGYGALSYLRNNGLLRNSNCGCGNCSCNGNCSDNCGCNNGCRVRNDYPWLVSCGGSSLFYSGNCGCTECSSCGSCSGCCDSCGCNGCDSCNGCGSCNNCNSNYYNICNGCNRCNGCNGCKCGNNCSCRSGSSAAEFTALAPQSCCSGGAIVFNGECDTNGCFSSDSSGIRINRDGRYAAIYTFASDACDNPAGVLSLALNGREMYSSRAFLSHAGYSGSRSVTGQAVFCARAGDLLTLNTGVAVNISQNSTSCPLATVLIWQIN